MLDGEEGDEPAEQAQYVAASTQPLGPPPVLPSPPWPSPEEIERLEGARAALRRSWEAPTPSGPWSPPLPCPRGTERHCLSEWPSRDLAVPEGQDPVSVAANYRRVFGGVEPIKRGAINTYSRRELSLLGVLRFI